jgi:hypothetical protein
MELFDDQSSDFLRIARAVKANVDDPARHDFANRIVAIDQMQALERQVERLSQPFGIFGSNPAPFEQVVYRHRASPSAISLTECRSGARRSRKQQVAQTVAGAFA